MALQNCFYSFFKLVPTFCKCVEVQVDPYQVLSNRITLYVVT